MMIDNIKPLVAGAVTLLVSQNAFAQSITFDDKQEWEAAVSQLGKFSTIDFTGMPVGQIEHDVYLDEFGVSFTDPFDQIIGPVSDFRDDFGLHGVINIELQFLSPQQWIAVDYPGGIAFELYQGNTLIEEVSGFPGGGVGFFGGLISPMVFDRVVLIGEGGIAAIIDNLHFGAPDVPAPGALALSIVALLGGQRRRRR